MSEGIGIAEARDRLSHIVNEVAYGDARYVIERRGRPLAVLISTAEYESLTQLLSKVKILDQIRGIPVFIHFDGERFFGTGPTLDVARDDYWLAVQEYHADLSADADRLAPYLTRRLAKLQAILAQAEET